MRHGRRRRRAARAGRASPPVGQDARVAGRVPAVHGAQATTSSRRESVSITVSRAERTEGSASNVARENPPFPAGFRVRAHLGLKHPCRGSALRDLSKNRPVCRHFPRRLRGATSTLGNSFQALVWSIGGQLALLVLQTGNALAHLRVHLRLGLVRASGWGRRAERREAHARAGGLLRAAGRARSGRLLRGSRRVAGALGRQRCCRRSGSLGVVEDGDLGTLLRGVDPASGARAAGAGAGADDHRPRARRRERRVAGGAEAARAGVRATTSSSRARRASACCTRSPTTSGCGARSARRTRSAWQAALGYLEREACVVRRGHGGAVREHGDGFVAAAFRHRTSRAQDPHLHTHVIVANMARTDDGEWRALDGEAILRTYRLAAGYLYEAQLRHELTRRLGLEWTEPVKGMARARRACRRRRSGRSRPGGSRCSSTWRRSAPRASPPPASPRSRPARRRSRSTCRGCASSGWRARPSTASAARELERLVRERPLHVRSRSSREQLARACSRRTG